MKLDKILQRLQGRKADILDRSSYMESAVLLPLIEVKGEPAVLFEVRAHHLKRQPGEICFPGGRIESSDKAAQMTAVRETCEELGVAPEQVEVVAPLDLLIAFFPVMINPFVGKLRVPLEALKPNPEEVGEVFTVPLEFLLKAEPMRHEIPIKMKPSEDFPFHLIPGGMDYNWRQAAVPEFFYKYEDKVIWGLTARILNHFVQLVRGGEY